MVKDLIRLEDLFGRKHASGTLERDPMEAMMDGIGKHAAFYRAYLPHDRSLVPVAVALGAVVALWLSLYLISAERNPQIVQKEARAAAVLVSRPVSH
jgi:hypothetical protein